MAAYAKLTTAQLTALMTEQIGTLKPYQIQQIMEALDRLRWDRGTLASVDAQPTVNTIITSLSTNQP